MSRTVPPAAYYYHMTTALFRESSSRHPAPASCTALWRQHIIPARSASICACTFITLRLFRQASDHSRFIRRTFRNMLIPSMWLFSLSTCYVLFPYVSHLRFRRYYLGSFGSDPVDSVYSLLHPLVFASVRISRNIHICIYLCLLQFATSACSEIRTPV